MHHPRPPARLLTPAWCPASLHPPRTRAAVCALLALKEGLWGWQHKRRRDGAPPRLELCGWAALAMCALLMATDMSGLAEVALPTNPGGVFKSPDIAAKSKVWSNWGFNQVQMRA